ncbi:hypothetical protein NECAME_13726 [Necator americanus]|uniref:Uncharacterized protein n=1 Tax=Necator americanus TaxID=51031 RepID=W2SVG4_NECAM|nr:hypothetical protein NECAME_13726 [Necator americanus]ETN72776.1 hypothetical protein NECAME_13726 [Necator americanus]
MCLCVERSVCLSLNDHSSTWSFEGKAEKIASKSSSDAEDPLAHGLDPSLYGPNAPVICASPCASDPGAVPSSSSFSACDAHLMMFSERCDYFFGCFVGDLKKIR